MEDGLQVAEDEKGELCHLHPPFRTGPEWLGGPVEEGKGNRVLLLSTKLVLNSASLQLSETFTVKLQRHELCHSLSCLSLLTLLPAGL